MSSYFSGIWPKTHGVGFSNTSSTRQSEADCIELSRLENSPSPLSNLVHPVPKKNGNIDLRDNADPQRTVYGLRLVDYPCIHPQILLTHYILDYSTSLGC